jgi:poly-gamma-glutamate synthase PgsB/CapB
MMPYLYAVVLLGCLALAAAGVLEQRRHDRNLDAIPVRVLVNGTRGKSTITRLIAGALRGGGLTTVAKTTGTAARFIHPDTSEEPVRRRFGIPDVGEQIGVVERAARYRPDALVMECMALRPPLQEVSQTKLIRATIGVLSNVRPDHLTEMGPTLDDVARSLSRAMPRGGVCVTAERDRLPLLAAEAARRDCRLLAVDPESVSDAELAGFDWLTFKENVAIALAVAELLGVPRGAALRGMWATPPDPGALTVTRYRHRGGLLRFANVMAANDPQSTLLNIAELTRQRLIRAPVYGVINCRRDRPERNAQMGAIVPALGAATVFLIGQATRSARRAIPDAWAGEVVELGDGEDTTQLILNRIPADASLVAVGNIHGAGTQLMRQLGETCTVEPSFVAVPEVAA